MAEQTKKELSFHNIEINKLSNNRERGSER